jgi:outer membrane protein assembly factor BamB
MLRHLSPLPALLLAVMLGSVPAIAQPGRPGGTAPNYTERALSATPLDRAIRQRHWVPGLNEGFVPQGLTYVRGTLFVGTYHSTDLQANRGAARIFAVDPKNGAVIGGFDLPASIGHADGLAATPDGGLLYLADNGRALYAFDLPRSLQAGSAVAVGAPRALEKDPALGSNFLAFDGKWLWFGRYSREDGAARLIAADPAILFGGSAKNGSGPFRAAEAARSLPLPFHAQGATFDAQGRLWISASNGRMGRLYRIDTQTGAVLAQHEAMAGLEDLARGEDGLLWGLSEAGSQRWNAWATFFPLLFSFDPAALR